MIHFCLAQLFMVFTQKMRNIILDQDDPQSGRSFKQDDLGKLDDSENEPEKTVSLKL